MNALAEHKTKAPRTGQGLGAHGTEKLNELYIAPTQTTRNTLLASEVFSMKETMVLTRDQSSR